MHELALYGQILKDEHHRMLQQLAGFARMQPQAAKVITLVFKARQPPGLEFVQSIGATNLGPQQQQDLQRVKNMLNAGLYYVHLIGEIVLDRKGKGGIAETADKIKPTPQTPKVRWCFEFKDTPEAGKQPVSYRLISRTPMEGDLTLFMDGFGFEYVSRYMVVGSRFYDNDTTLFVHKVLLLPQVPADQAMLDIASFSDVDKLSELDGSGGYIVKASIDIVDGNNAELKDKATRQLLGIKESLKQAVDLTPGDRLALDTRLPATSRRT